MIEEFDKNNCTIEEGQFVSDKLDGFGRFVKSDKMTNQIGFFKQGKLHGYGMEKTKNFKDGRAGIY